MLVVVAQFGRPTNPLPSLIDPSACVLEATHSTPGLRSVDLRQPSSCASIRLTAIVSTGLDPPVHSSRSIPQSAQFRPLPHSVPSIPLGREVRSFRSGGLRSAFGLSGSRRLPILAPGGSEAVGTGGRYVSRRSACPVSAPSRSSRRYRSLCSVRTLCPFPPHRRRPRSTHSRG